MHLSVLLPFLMLTFLGRIFFFALLQLQDHFAERLEIVLNFDSFEGFAKLVGKRHLKMMENLKFQKNAVFSLVSNPLLPFLQAQPTRRWYITSFRLSSVVVRSIARWPDSIYIMHYPVTLTL